jgi:hypothetical protein
VTKVMAVQKALNVKARNQNPARSRKKRNDQIQQFVGFFVILI